MARLVSITLPKGSLWDCLPSVWSDEQKASTCSEHDRSLPFEEVVLKILKDKKYTFGVTCSEGMKTRKIVFRSQSKRLGPILGELQDDFGIGLHIGTVDVLQLNSTNPPLPSWSTDAENKTTCLIRGDHMNSDEIHQIVNSQAALNFDYMMMLVVGSMIAAVGLITDSSVTVVASMLVSPLMGPILRISFGVVVCDARMITHGVRNELIGIFITFAIGAICGLCTGPFFGEKGWMIHLRRNKTIGNELVSNEIESRADYWALIPGFFLAVPSGLGCALAITGGGVNALVGVAISAALLPPIVNSGFCFTINFFFETNHWLVKGGWSFVLFLMNLVVILLTAILTFKVRKKMNSTPG